MRRSVAAGLVLAVALTAGCGGAVEIASVPVSATVPLSPPAAAGMPKLELIGGTRAERRAVRAAVAVLGEHSQIGTVRFGYVRVGKGEKGRAVTVESRPGLPSERMEGGWQAELIARDLVRRLRQANRTLAQLTLTNAGHSYDRRLWPSPLLSHPKTASALKTEIEQRADAAGYEIRRLRALQLGRTPAIAVVIRLSEEDLFDDRCCGGLVFPQTSFKDSFPYYLAVEAPEGTRISAVWWIAARKMFMSAGGHGLDREGFVTPSDPPAFLDGPTSLDIVVHRGLEDRHERYELDCQPQPVGIPDAVVACERLLRERWSFFMPNPGAACSIPPGSDTIGISGTLGGRSIERGYSPCHHRTLWRWIELLGAEPAR